MKLKSLLLTVFFVSCATSQANSAGHFKINSTDVKPDSMLENKYVFDGFGCLGENVSPQISWMDAPKGTKSFAITVYDPDAPTGSGWWHWLLVNIPTNYSSVRTDFGSADQFKIEDDILQIRNDFGLYKFGGACPPKGHKPHHYIFTVYALKTDKLEIEKHSSAALAGFMINQNVLAKASFTAKYKR